MLPKRRFPKWGTEGTSKAALPRKAREMPPKAAVSRVYIYIYIYILLCIYNFSIEKYPSDLLAEFMFSNELLMYIFYVRIYYVK